MKKTLLMISNSFGVNLQTYAHQIAKESGLDFDIYVLYIGGCTLEMHWNNIQSGEKVYELFHNGLSTGTFVSIQEAIAIQHWDFISLQQGSHFSGVEESYYPYFEKVYNWVKESKACDEIIFHKTWAYSAKNPVRYKEEWLALRSFEAMQNGIDHCVSKVTSEFNVKTLLNSSKVVNEAMNIFDDVYDEVGFHMNWLGDYLIGANAVRVLFNCKLSKVYYAEHLNRADCEKAIEFINSFKN